MKQIKDLDIDLETDIDRTTVIDEVYTEHILRIYAEENQPLDRVQKDSKFNDGILTCHNDLCHWDPCVRCDTGTGENCYYPKRHPIHLCIRNGFIGRKLVYEKNGVEKSRYVTKICKCHPGYSSKESVA